MEREFLLGVDFNLYVDKPTYESWLNLLKGLVMAKERDSRRFRKSRGLVRSARLAHPPSSSGPAARPHSSQYRPASHRARSTSPTRAVPCPYPSQVVSHAPPATAVGCSPAPRSGSKRSAEAAFSPTSATFSHMPAKRPISLHIPEFGPATGGGPHSHSPLEGLQSFAKMTLASPHAPQPVHHHNRGRASSWMSGPKDAAPETLVAAYSMDEARRTAAPQVSHLFSPGTRGTLILISSSRICTFMRSPVLRWRVRKRTERARLASGTISLRPLRRRLIIPPSPLPDLWFNLLRPVLTMFT